MRRAQMHRDRFLTTGQHDREHEYCHDDSADNEPLQRDHSVGSSKRLVVSCWCWAPLGRRNGL